MEEIVYGTSVTPRSTTNCAWQWGGTSSPSGRPGRAWTHTTFVACARVDGVCVAMGRILFDYGYTAYLGMWPSCPPGQGRGDWPADRGAAVPAGPGRRPAGETIMFFLGAAKGKEPFYEKLGFETSPSDTAGSGMRKTVTKA